MRVFTGFGKLAVAGCGEIENSFTLKFRSDGKTEVIFNITPVFSEASPMLNKVNKEKVVFGDLIGSLDNPSASIEAKKLVLNAINFNSANNVYDIQLLLKAFHPIIIDYEPIEDQDEVEIRYGLTNLRFFGHEETKRGTKHSLDTIKVSVASQEVRITQLENYQEIVLKFRDGQQVQITSEMIVNTKYSKLEDIDEISKNICMLISFANGNWITDLYQDIYKNGVLSKTIIKPLKTYPFTQSLSSIDSSIHGDRDFETYLITSYPEYVKYKDELGLNIVIEYYISGFGSKILELSFLIGAITIECIDSYLEGYFARRSISKDLRTFRKRTRILLDEFNVSFSESELSFIRTRNSVVHSGKFPLGVNPLDEVTSLYNLIDRCLLTILGYKGNRYYNQQTRQKEMLS